MAAATCFIGIGSNLGDRRSLCLEALRRLEKLPSIRIIAVSSLYETEPVGEGYSSPFLNGAAELSTTLSPREFLTAVLSIEGDLGRDRSREGSREGSKVGRDRTIDIDLLLFGDLVLHEPGLTIPHPRLHERRFVLEPLADIAPDVIHPVFKEKVSDLLKRLSDPHRVRRLS
jgi:2-amino-4-hydroxy-6-hydroxymethyldihydropteridine diphosphokinase